MRVTAERVELFHLLAKLLWYLISGRSHVGYLHNYKENPIHEIVPPALWHGLIDQGRDTGVHDTVDVEESMSEIKSPEIPDFEGEHVASADSSFSEATDEDRQLDEEVEGFDNWRMYNGFWNLSVLGWLVGISR
jgi:hypothetical protein